MARRFAKILSWLCGAIAALVLAAYAVLFAVNLDDRPPAAEIAVLSSRLEPASPVLSASNSYIFILGFAGPPEVDPSALGRERYEWMERARPEFYGAGDPLGGEYNFQALRTDAVAQLARACSDSEAKCLRFLDSGEDAVEQWLTDEAWLLDRYRILVGLTEFQEAMSFEVLAPLPPYHVVFEGQKLLIANAWRSASHADAAAVRDALDRDLTFWRMVLERSDVLITKMIATAAIARHFKLGNIVLRHLPRQVAAGGIPTSWHNRISDEERSMERSLAGEWTFFDAMNREIAADPATLLGDRADLTGSATWDRVAWALFKPFWQPQDVSNRYARLMLDLSNAFDVPYHEIPEAVSLANDLQRSAFRPFSRPYNLVGDIVMASAFWSLSEYAVRVADLEGIRRVALLTAELRATGTSRDEIAQRVLDSELVNPYTNAPFTWVDEEGVIVFHGLEPNEERAQHKLIF